MAKGRKLKIFSFFAGCGILDLGFEKAGYDIELVNEFFKPKDESAEPANDGEKCPKCGADLPPNAKFCLSCGERIQHDNNMVVCPNCGKTVPKGKFCFECGYKFSANTCPKCGAALPEGAKFCLECGERL